MKQSNQVNENGLQSQNAATSTQKELKETRRKKGGAFQDGINNFNRQSTLSRMRKEREIQQNYLQKFKQQDPVVSQEEENKEDTYVQRTYLPEVKTKNIRINQSPRFREKRDKSISPTIYSYNPSYKAVRVEHNVLFSTTTKLDLTVKDLLDYKGVQWK